MGQGTAPSMRLRELYDARVPKWWLVLAALALMLSLAKAADAAPRDAQALKLDDDAINNDYLATKFGDAEKKLKQGIAICGKGACSPNVVGQLHRDLGIIYVVASRPDEAKAQFVEALKVDPSTALPKELTTPEIEQVFSAAKGGPAPAPTPAPGPPAAPVPGPAPPPAKPPASSGGDEIVHTPPAESAVMTPLPLYAELPESMPVTKVVIRYKAFGAPDWKSVDMKKTKTGYGIELPCAEIGTTPGDLKYFIQAVGPSGEVIATNGTKNAPLRVAIKQQITGDAPHLPGKPAPKPCSGLGGAECPPEFPGCKASKKAGGLACDVDSECQSEQCKNGTCFAEEGAETKCDSDTGCEAGQWCNAGICASAKKNWIGFAVQQDMIFAQAEQDVCLTQTDYTCFDGEGSYYDPGHALQGRADAVAGGFTLSTTRVLLAYDRVIAANVSLGARVGYAFGGAPIAPGAKAFFPAHIEARGAYWFGSDPFVRIGFRPYVVLAVGAAQFDGKVAVKADSLATPMVRTDLEAWKKVGIGFGAAGFGLMYGIDHNSGVVAELKGAVGFPTSGIAASFQLGYSRGLF
jgi:hypothetical protein